MISQAAMRFLAARWRECIWEGVNDDETATNIHFYDELHMMIDCDIPIITLPLEIHDVQIIN